MYKLIILGFLFHQPTHGYAIAKIINMIIGPFAKFSKGRLYPLLTKLEQEKMIEIVPIPVNVEKENKRDQKTYCITEKGRAHFHELMLDTSTNLGEYQKLFWQKVAFFNYITGEERLYLLEHYIHYCQTHIYHDRKQTDVLKQGYMNAGSKDTANYYKNFWQFELSQVLELYERERNTKNKE
ncbi:PadR family transcriptional regulator [Shimazuella sp. AN120528]|uniref:PadR family transcriptional regulator n=1 Tax=Shimazuella soli TaxID=1892854 RepID=UPI001F1006CF|nr:PadR family transcriptional regulator [Shimazuella soli]MCH5584817.1 PadR family transcriptional regulator [Shimazuella soli]